MTAENKENPNYVPTSFSASLIADTGYLDLRTGKILLVRQQASKKWGPPAGHSFFQAGEVLEAPAQTVVREWREETGGMNLAFNNKPRLERVIYSYDKEKNKASVGFVFLAYLKDAFVRRIFKSNPRDVLGHFPRRISTEFETDMVGLFDSHQVTTMLLNWQRLIYRPELNGDLLLDWRNDIVQGHSDMWLGSSKCEIPRARLGFTWSNRNVFWQTSDTD